MNRDNYGLRVDIYYMLLLLEWLICTLYIGMLAQDKILHLAVFTVALAVMCITHFISLSAGLIANITLFFITFSYQLLQMIQGQETVIQGILFWNVMFFVLAVTESKVFGSITYMEEENQNLKNRLAFFDLIDDKTGLKNTRAFYQELPVYQKLAGRYETGITLIIWEFKFEHDLRKIVGKERVREAAVQISEAVLWGLRREDTVYLLSDKPWQWGALLLTKNNNEQVITNKVKRLLEEIDFEGEKNEKSPQMDMRISVYYTGDFSISPEMMLEAARKKLQYDV